MYYNLIISIEYYCYYCNIFLWIFYIVVLYFGLLCNVGNDKFLVKYILYKYIELLSCKDYNKKNI